MLLKRENHLRKCSKSSVIREIQIKTTLRLYLTPIRMDKTKKLRYMWVEKEEHSPIAGGTANWFKHPGNQSGGSSENWKQIYLQIQQYHSWEYSQKMPHHVRGHHVP